MVVVIAVAAVTVDTALLGLIAPLLPEIERRTGASEAALGASLAAYAVPIVLLSLPLGRLADSVGRRGLLIAGLVLAAAGSGVIAASESIWPLMLGRVIQGVGSAASWIAALALVSDRARPAGGGRRSVSPLVRPVPARSRGQHSGGSLPTCSRSPPPF